MRGLTRRLIGLFLALSILFGALQLPIIALDYNYGGMGGNNGGDGWGNIWIPSTPGGSEDGGTESGGAEAGGAESGGDDPSIPTSGEIGSVRWTLSDDGCLTFSGTGVIPACSELGIISYVNSVVIEKGITGIGDSAFEWLSLVSITIPDSVKSIGYRAFGSCDFTSITLPNSVTSIGDSAFEYCRNLESITIPNSVTSIGNSAFAQCNSLTSIVIPNSVTFIGEYAFEYCRSLESVTISNGVGVLGGYAFYSCDRLAEVVFEKNSQLVSIGHDAFSGCTSLKSITLPNSLNTIGFLAFENCTSLKSITISDSVTTIGMSAFSGCTSLNTITLPDRVMQIQGRAFDDTAYYNNSANWDNDVLYIGKHLICAKEGLSGTYTVKNGTRYIADDAFFRTELTSVTIPDSVISIGSEVFPRESLVSVTFAKNSQLTTVGDYAFSWCVNLQSITLPDSVTSIGTRAFETCTGLTSITLPDSLIRIGEAAFAQCHGLTSITIPDSVTDIGVGAFGACGNLENIYVGENNRVFYSEGTCLINRETKTLIQGAQNGIIPNDGSVIHIGDMAFLRYYDLTSVTIPECVTSIGESAFSSCGSLTDIIIPDSVTSIGAGAFSGTALTSVVIPNSVTTIAGSTFAGCGNLTSVTLPYGLFGIEGQAFSSCEALVEMVIPRTVVEIAEDAFESYASDFTLWVYPDSYAYEYAVEYEIGYQFIRDSSLTLSVNVLDADGEALTSGYEVYWYDGNTFLGKGNQIVLTERPSQVRYQVLLGEELTLIYQAPETKELPADVTKVSVVLLPLEEISISGRVTDLSGQPIGNASMTVTQGTGSFSKQISLLADENGYFSFDAKRLYTKIRISADGYYNRIVTAEVDELSADGSLGNLQMTPLPSHKITVSGFLTKTALSDEQAQQIELTHFDGLSFSIRNLTTSREITDFSVQYPYLLPSKDSISSGDMLEIEVVDTYGQKTAKAVQVQLDENCLAEVNFFFVENGRLSIQGITGSTNNSVMAFDEKGERVLYDSITNSYLSAPLPNGTYTVIVAGHSVLWDNMNHLSKFAMCGVEAGVDYASKQVTLSSGKLTQIADMTVPMLNEERLWYTEKTQTFLTVNHTVSTVGSTLLLRCAYQLKPTYSASGETVTLELPEGFTVSSGSVFLNGEAVNYTVNGQVVTVATNLSQGVLYVYVIPTSAVDSCDVNAFLSFVTGDATVTQPLGKVSLQVVNATFSAPETTGTQIVDISGKALPKSRITVFDNGVTVATTTANSAGSYKVSIPLTEPGNSSYHLIYAHIENDLYGIAYDTESSWVHYSIGYCCVKTLDVINGSQSMTIDFQNHTLPENYTWTGEYSYSYRVTFFEGSADRLSDVYVVTVGSNGTETYIPLTNHPGTDMWVGSIIYQDSRLLPCSYNVVYNEAVSDIIYVDEQPFYDGVLQIEDELEKLGVDLTESIDVIYEETDDSATVILLDKKNNNETLMQMTQKNLTYTEKSENLWLSDGYTKMIDNEDTVVYVKKSNTEFSETYEVIIPSTKQRISCSIVLNENWFAKDGPSLLSSDISMDGAKQFAEGLLTMSTFLLDFALAGLPGQLKLCNDVIKMNDAIANNDIIFSSWAEILPLALQKKCPDGEFALSLEERGAFYAEYLDLVEEYSTVREALYFEVQSYQGRMATVNFALGRLPHAKSAVLTTAHFRTLAAIGGFAMLGAGTLTSQVINQMIKKTHEAYMEKLMDLRDRINAAAQCPDEPEDDDTPEPPETPPEKPKKKAAPDKGVNVPILIDPSGYVCEAVPSNRLEGVKVEAYYYDSEKGDVFWNAEEWDQVNPLYTDANGRYAWDVPIGLWLVKFSKDGYYDADSKNDPAADENGYLPVPPPQTEVNIALVSKKAPTVKLVRAYTETIRIEFSQYMTLDSVNTQTVIVTSDGKRIEGSVVPLNAEASFDDPAVKYASVFAFVPKNALNDSVTVSIQGVINYAGTAIENAYEENLKVQLLPKELVVPQSVTVVYQESAHFIVELLPKEAGADKTVTVTSLTPGIISVQTATVTTDQNGRALVTMKGELPGNGMVRVTVEGTDLTADVAVISQTALAANTCQKVTSNVESGSKVPAGTKIILSTETEGATIYYTLDLSCPCDENNPARIRYEGPITITEDVTIIAYAVKEGMSPSATAGFSYTVGEFTCLDDPNIPHTYDEGVVIRPATADEEGVIQYTCTVCGQTKTESIAKLNADGDFLSYGLLLILAFVVVGGVAIFVCCYVIKKKRSRNKTENK